MRDPSLIEDLPILFVDDEPELLNALRRTIRRTPWEADFADGAVEAMRYLEANNYSVVVADFRMPSMDGVEFLARVLERWPNTERVLLTAYADAEALERGINEARIGRFMRKPWKREVLLGILGDAMAQNRLQREHAVLQDRLRHRNEELLYLNELLRTSVEESAQTIVRFRRRWDVALSAISDAIVIVGPEYAIEGCNEAAAEVAEMTVDALEGRRCHEALFGRPSPCEGCPIGRGSSRLTRHVGEAAQVFDARSYSLPGGAELCVYRDVTRELAFQEEAAQMDKMAAIGRLAGGVAHEINNPLHGILSFVQLAQKPDVSPGKLERYHDVIKECALRCRDIVLALRDFSRRADPKDRARVDLNDVCAKSMVLFENIKEKNVVFTPWSAGAFTSANSNQLQQVVVNLIQNGLDASPPGGTVRVKVERAPDGWVVAVEDDGMGIPSQERERIFEPFYTTKPEGMGTGLGLAISHNIVRDHGGALRALDGRVGGARFEMQLPRLERPKTVPEPEPNEAAANPAGPTVER